MKKKVAMPASEEAKNIEAELFRYHAHADEAYLMKKADKENAQKNLIVIVLPLIYSNACLHHL